MTLYVTHPLFLNVTSQKQILFHQNIDKIISGNPTAYSNYSVLTTRQTTDSVMAVMVCTVSLHARVSVCVCVCVCVYVCICVYVCVRV